jgi:hypothetical protein
MILLIILALILTPLGLAVTTQELAQTASTSFAALIYTIPGVLIATGLRGAILSKMAVKLGDHYCQKDFSWNPVEFLDPMGSLACIFFSLGWPRPVHYDRRMFNRPLFDEFRLYFAATIFNILAGCLSLLAWLFAPLLLGGLPVDALKNIGWIFELSAQINFMVGFWSLLPLYPLPGFLLLQNLLSPVQRFQMEAWKSHLMLVLMVLLFLFSHWLLSPVREFSRLLIQLGPIWLATLSLSLMLWLLFAELKIHRREGKVRARDEGKG